MIVKLYRDFEDLLFSISKADGRLTIEDLEQKSAYAFYRYKAQLTEYINRNKGRERNKDSS